MQCKKCGKEIPQAAAFCLYCGEAVASSVKCKECPRCGTVREADMVYCHQCGTLLNAVTVTGQEVYRLRMVSKYDGEPTLGIVKGTGTLIIYDDHIEFDAMMGGNLGFFNRKQANDVYQMEGVEDAFLGKYAGLMPMLVLKLKTGVTYSFASLADGDGVRKAVETIDKYRKYT